MSKFTPEYIRRALFEHAQACVIAGTTNNPILANAAMEAITKQIEAAFPDEEVADQFQEHECPDSRTDEPA